MFTIGVLKEPAAESRVSLLPEAVAALRKKGLTVLVEAGAGIGAFASDESYQQAGAQIVGRAHAIQASQLILSIHTPVDLDGGSFNGKALIGVYQPLYVRDRVESWAQQGVICFSLDMLPRTTRAQSMDVLSSQANIAGYKAVLLAATEYGRYFPMFMTAAGSIAPAKILILGAGVAGLQAIATARRLGAVVEVFDTRPAVKEEVMSLGGKFIEVEGAADASQAGGYAVEQSDEFKQRQRARIAESAIKSDIIITTAQIPGKKAPLLITEDMIDGMRAGSIIVDLAAATGGNTPFTENDKTIERGGVRIFGNSNLAASMSADASKLYGKNIQNFLQLLIGADGEMHLNWNDELVSGACITHEGKVVHPRLTA
ncbi:MAG: Re/Si-specific NAD(P)(+) transhydrogenase subunit alpha [Bacteroidetes bacterium]|nr:Re/Si-specific NAD(P)(+) transhydrogenase subunit alpha [Bacteroidota bacterium]